MPVLVVMAILFAGGVWHFQTVGFFGQTLNIDKVIREGAERNDMVREMGPLVREAFDIASRTGGACPAPGTQLITVNGQQLCWKTENDGCIASTSAAKVQMQWICRTAESITRLGWPHLLLPQAHANTNVTTLAPRSVGTAEGGVRVRAPDCGGPPDETPCIDCSRSDTTCMTLTFCVSGERRTSCDLEERVEQTFAFRRI